MDSGTVDLIATDPPFNKSRDFHSTPGKLRKDGGGRFQDRWSWERDVEEEWVEQIADDHPRLMAAIENARHTHSDSMAAFLCFMSVRIVEMKRLLKPTGSIFLHCDWTASHYLKMMLDGIFTTKGFRNEIVWCYTGPGNAKKQFPRKHETIFWYTKGKKWTFNYDDIRVPYQKMSTGKTNSIFSESYELDKRGKIPETWWAEAPGNGLTPAPKQKGQYVGYPTQKPIALYARIIQAASNPGDVVLDPFCGCATTLVAAEILERQWVGIDIWEEAHDLVIERLQEKLVLDSDEKPETNPEDFFVKGKVHYRPDIPLRNDDGEIATPYLKPKIRSVEISPDPKMSNREIREALIREHGKVCQGCFRKYEDDRILELDHIKPRVDGGHNGISNKMLLCPPCNKLKGSELTHHGLLKRNHKEGRLQIPLKEALERSKVKWAS